MGKKDAAEIMLPVLYQGRVDELGTMCEVFITCREYARKGMTAGASPEEVRSAEEEGMLADEVLKLIRKQEYRSIEEVLKRCQ